MRLKTITAVASAAALLAVGAPAMALTVTLNVDVTGATGVANFTPFSFQETWTFSPTDTVHPGMLSSPLPGIIPATRHETESFAGSPATVTGSPLTGDLLALAGFSTVDGGVSHVDYGRNSIFDAANTPTSTNSTVEFFSSRTVNTLEDDKGTSDVLDDVYLFQDYSQSIEGFGSAVQTPAGMTDAAFATYLAGLGPMSWSESASQSTGSPFGSFPTVFQGSEDYVGTASVVLETGGVPEPADWALMILGFGGAGAALRRRRTAQAA
jgi:hypothetical protein